MKENFKGMEYSILSRREYSKDPKEKNFGDVLFEFSQNFNQDNIGSFITTHISRRSNHYGSCDPLRINFLNCMVALNVLIPIKVGSENGYKINRQPEESDFLNAYNYANGKHDNDRGFEAYGNNDTLLRRVANKSTEMMSYLISTLFSHHGYEVGKEYDIDKIKSDLGKLYKIQTIEKIINCLTIEGAIEINYYVNQEDGQVEDTRVHFNRIKLRTSDLSFYAKCTCIPGDCKNVHRITFDNRIKPVSNVPMFEEWNDLMTFFKSNMEYLIKSGKMAEFMYKGF